MGYWCELDAAPLVQRTIVADFDPAGHPDYGGSWAETFDLDNPADDPRVYAGPGYGHDPSFPEQFSTVWDQTEATTPDESGNYRYQITGDLCWHNGLMWKNTIVTGTPNVWEPGVSGWHNVPVGGGLPQWVQPTGAHDAYKLDELVTHNGSDWRSDVADNVWEPGVSQWTEIPSGAEFPPDHPGQGGAKGKLKGKGKP